MDDDALRDIFAGLGQISIRKMFGGRGVYHQGTIFAIVIRGELMLKADADTGRQFAAAGCKQWTYTGSRHGKLVAMPYWSVPDSALDDPEDMTPWARIAYEAGLRSEKN